MFLRSENKKYRMSRARIFRNPRTRDRFNRVMLVVDRANKRLEDGIISENKKIGLRLTKLERKLADVDKQIKKQNTG